jgi:hypothetical protein
MANLVRGTFLRIADVRSQPANISVAASRSTPSRRVVPSRKLPDRRHHRTPTATRHRSRAPTRAVRCPQTMPSTRQNRRLDKPFHIRAYCTASIDSRPTVSVGRCGSGDNDLHLVWIEGEVSGDGRHRRVGMLVGPDGVGDLSVWPVNAVVGGAPLYGQYDVVVVERRAAMSTSLIGMYSIGSEPPSLRVMATVLSAITRPSARTATRASVG